MSTKIFISGRPGIGKTTVFNRVINALKHSGLKVGGIICPEVRVSGRRIGFDIVDIASSRRGILARLCELLRPQERGVMRIGRYCINEHDTIEIGVNAIYHALNNSHVVAIDEIGPMELKVTQLRNAIHDALKSNKVIIAVIHRNIAIRYSNIYKASLFWITESNREHIHNEILDIILKRR